MFEQLAQFGISLGHQTGPSGGRGAGGGSWAGLEVRLCRKLEESESLSCVRQWTVLSSFYRSR